jgi:hypothetical protein
MSKVKGLKELLGVGTKEDKELKKKQKIEGERLRSIFDSNVVELKNAIKTLRKFTQVCIPEVSSSEPLLVREIQSWCNFYYHIVDRYDNIRMGHVMRKNQKTGLGLVESDFIEMSKVEHYFFRYRSYLNEYNIPAQKDGKCLFYKPSLEYLNYW